MENSTVRELTYSRIPERYGGIADIRGTLWLGMAAGLAAALGASTVLVASLINPLLFLIAGVLQGCSAGLGLILLTRHMRFGGRTAMTVAAVLAGVASVAAIHASVWVHDAYVVAGQITTNPADRLLQTAEVGFGRAYGLLDQSYKRHTGHTGLVGCVVDRLSRRPSNLAIAGSHVILTIGGALLVVGQIAGGRRCIVCAGRLGKAQYGAVVPFEQGKELADAIRAEDNNRVVAMLHEFGNAPLGTGCAIVHFGECGGCGSEYAWVEGKVYGTRGGAHTAVLAEVMVISAGMRESLRSR